MRIDIFTAYCIGFALGLTAPDCSQQSKDHPAPLVEQVVPVATLDDLIRAIATVESGNDPNAVGAAGELGILQIRPIMVEEVNRICELQRWPARYTPEDRRDPVKSELMFRTFADYWAAHTGDLSLEGIARRWNGGPQGHTKDATVEYWAKVQAEMDRQRGKP